MEANLKNSAVTLNLGGTTAEDVIAVARQQAPVMIADAVLAELGRVRTHIEQMAASDTPVYGVSTGFGALATRHIPQADRAKLQRSLIRSHAAGMGEPV
ncbi:aromatic amino acid lyase, partial [Glutamicibacter creatinolyticus]